MMRSALGREGLPADHVEDDERTRANEDEDEKNSDDGVHHARSL
jgi:hypothetical protein